MEPLELLLTQIHALPYHKLYLSSWIRVYDDTGLGEDQRDELLWQVALSGSFALSSAFFDELAKNHLEGLSDETAWALARERPHGLTWSAAPLPISGWTSPGEAIYRLLARRDPAGFAASIQSTANPEHAILVLAEIDPELAHSVRDGIDWSPLAARLVAFWGSSPAMARLQEHLPWLEARPDWMACCVEALPDAPRVCHWEHLPPYLAALPDEDLLALAIKQGSPWPQLTEALVARGPHLEGRLRTIFEAHPGGSRNSDNSFPRAAITPALAILADKSGQPLPDGTREVFEAILGRGAHHAAVWAPVLRALPHEMAVGVLTARIDRCDKIFGVIPDVRLLDKAMRRLEALPTSRIDRGLLYAEGLACAGDAWVRPMVEALDGGALELVAAAVVIEALGMIGDPGAASAIGRALGHRSKIVRVHAVKALRAIGSDGVEGVLVGLRARKKAAREGALEVLQALEPTPALRTALDAAIAEGGLKPEIVEVIEAVASDDASPATAVLAASQALTDAQRDVYAGQWEVWLEDPNAPKPFQTADDPIEALLAFGELLRSSPWHNSSRLFEVTRGLEGDPRLPWAVLEMIADLSPFNIKSMLQALASLEIEDGWLEPFEAYTDRLQARIEMIGWLLEQLSADVADAAALEYLNDSGVKVRAAARLHLTRRGASVIPRIASLLAARRKDTRRAAAETLRDIAHPDALPHLEAALETEQVATNAQMIERALAACEAEPTLDLDTAAEPKLDAWLGERAPEEDPRLTYDLDGIGGLRWLSGAPLSDAAERAFLHMLTLESPKHQGELPRALRPRLDRVTLEAVGRQLRRGFHRKNSPKTHRWMIASAAVTATSTWFEDTLHTRWALNLDAIAIAERHHSVTARTFLWDVKRSSDRSLERNRYSAIQGAMASEATRLGYAQGGWLGADWHDHKWAVGFGEVGRHGFGDAGARQSDHEGAYFRFTLAPVAVAAPGHPVEALRVDVEPVDGEVIGSAGELKAVGAARKIKEAVSFDLEALLERLTTWQTVWCWGAWARDCLRHPIGAVVTRRLVFARVPCTEEGADLARGVRFVLDAHQRPRDLNGALLPIGDEDLITCVDPATIEPEELAVWAEATRYVETLWPAEPPALSRSLDHLRGGLTSLRGLLSAPDATTWEALTTLLSTWPVEELPMALDYVRPHLGHEALAHREAPEGWALSLMAEGQSARKKCEPHLLLPFDDPRLGLCNTLSLRGTIRHADAKKLAKASHLKGLRTLRLDRVKLTSGTVSFLKDAACFGELETLALHYSSIDSRHLGVLLSASWLEAVKAVKVDSYTLDEGWQEALEASGHPFTVSELW